MAKIQHFSRKVKPVEKLTEKLFYGKYAYRLHIRRRPVKMVAQLVYDLYASVASSQMKLTKSSSSLFVFTDSKKLFNLILSSEKLFVYEYNRPYNTAHKLKLDNPQERVVLRKPYFGKYHYRIEFGNSRPSQNIMDIYHQNPELIRCTSYYHNTIMYMDDENYAATIRMMCPEAIVYRVEDPTKR